MSKIPNKKHSKEELSRIQRQGAMQVNQNATVQAYTKQLASKFTIFLGYSLPFITIVWWIIIKAKIETPLDGFQVRDIFIMVIPIALALSVALWIALKKALSRHNAAFICIFCLFCCFPIFTTINASEVLKADLLALVGKEMPIVADPLTEDSEPIVDPNSSGITEAERLELLEYKKQLELENKDKIRQRAHEKALKEAREDLNLGL